MARESEWRETVVSDQRTSDVSDVRVRSISEFRSAPKRLIDEIYFDGLDILRCYEGRFRFSFNDRKDVVLEAGEALVIYPRHKVTIDALAKSNYLVYGIFEGREVERYFDAIGFFDCAKGRTPSHYDSIVELRRQLAKDDRGLEHQRHCLTFLTDILSTQVQEMRESGCPLLFDAIKLLHQNLARGQARLEPLCKELKVCRSYLHRIFVEAGLESPSEMIRQKQLRMAQGLLLNTRETVSSIAGQTAFLSASHFVTFFKRMTGMTPSEFRESARRELIASSVCSVSVS